jgi:hypothetical protein
MSRSGYTDDWDGSGWLWMGAVARAIKGKRGQQMLRELLAALEAMPVKRLIAEELEYEGEVCALGALGRQRGVDMSKIDPEDREKVAEAFGVAEALAAEIMFMNDEGGPCDPEARWHFMHNWVCGQIVEEPGHG